MNENDYYTRLWNSAEWGGPHPNHDEQLRWGAIKKLIERYIYRGRPLEKILDVGCGRGWLTDQLQYYGETQGLEVVPEAVEIAKKLFPKYTFCIANTSTLTMAEQQRFGNADLVVSSEVIEHIPNTEKLSFLCGIHRLLRPSGFLILTTPRGELWSRWSSSGNESQPIEQWVTEPELSALAKSAGLTLTARTRVHLPGYDYDKSTAWLLRGRVVSRIVRRVPALHKSIQQANGFYQVAVFQKGK